MRAKIYTCDDCGARGEFTSYVKARAAWWAVAKDYEKCYCPNCAPNHRHGGAASTRKGRQTRSRQWEQLQIEI
ncbi:MAG: hypothetical protein K2L42_07110 [Clostridia bacterium]|nr:hypothetical protein [Clostridia bacterium]